MGLLHRTLQDDVHKALNLPEPHLHFGFSTPKMNTPLSTRRARFFTWLGSSTGTGTGQRVPSGSERLLQQRGGEKDWRYLCLGIYCIHVNESLLMRVLFVFSSLAVSLYSLATLFQERRVTSPSSLGYLHKSPRKTRPKMKQMDPTVR